MKKIILALLLSFSLNAYEVLSFGNAFLDYIVFVDHEFIEKLPGEKGGSCHVPYETFCDLTKENADKRAGGSSVNTLKGLAMLDHDCAIVGRIGNGQDGKDYKKSLDAYGVSHHFAEFTSLTPRLVCMVTPDGDRTMRSYLGNLSGFDVFSFDPNIFQGIAHFHIEGYQIPNVKLIQNFIKLAKEQGATTSMDLGCFELVRQYKEDLLDLIENHLDIVFMNADEANILLGLEPEKAAKKLAQMCSLAIVTNSEKGGHVSSKSEHFHYPAIRVKPKDATGAGDLFIAGFLHGFLSKKSLKESAYFGTVTASQVVQVVGTEIPDYKWNEILPLIHGQCAHVRNDH